MAGRREAPEPWASAMRAVGYVDRERPSIRQLALGAGVSVETARRMVLGIGEPELESVDAVAAALRVDARTVAGWVGYTRSVEEPWTPPAEAGLLTREQRAALDHVIRVMVEPGGAAGLTEPSAPLRRVARRGSRSGV